jgi:hypothetical protein
MYRNYPTLAVAGVETNRQIDPEIIADRVAGKLRYNINNSTMQINLSSGER